MNPRFLFKHKFLYQLNRSVFLGVFFSKMSKSLSKCATNGIFEESAGCC